MKFFKKIATAYAAIKLSQTAYGGLAKTLASFGAATHASDCGPLALEFAGHAEECSAFAAKYDELLDLMNDAKARAIVHDASKLGTGGMRLLAAYCDRAARGDGAVSEFMAAQSQALCEGWDKLRHAILNPAEESLSPAHRSIALQHCAVAVSTIGIASRALALSLKEQGHLDFEAADRLADRVRRSEQDMIRLSKAASAGSDSTEKSTKDAAKQTRIDADMGARSEIAQIHYLSGNKDKAREVILDSLAGKTGPELEAALAGWDREMRPARGNEPTFALWCPHVLKDSRPAPESPTRTPSP